MVLKIIDFNIEKITAYGHQNIRATHRTTFEITCEKDLSIRGNCIIGVKADKSARKLDEKTKKLLKNDNSYVFIILKSGELYDLIIAKGSSKLLLSSNKSMVFRKSEYIDDRTVAIHSNKASYDIDRALIEKLVKGSILEVFLLVILYDKG